MNKLSKLSYGLAVVLFATTAANILGMDQGKGSPTDSTPCGMFSEADIRRMSDEQFVEHFEPCMSSVFSMYWKTELRRRQQEELTRLQEEQKARSSWSHKATGFGLFAGNTTMTVVCPFVAQLLTGGIQDTDTRVTANIGANIGCQMVRSFLFESYIQRRNLDDAVRARKMKDLRTGP